MTANPIVASLDRRWNREHIVARRVELETEMAATEPVRPGRLRGILRKWRIRRTIRGILREEFGDHPKNLYLR
jgi:hypothetical protein